MEHEKKVKVTNSWVQKCGGMIRLSLTEGTSVVIVEMARMNQIINRFEIWRSSLNELADENALDNARDTTGSPPAGGDHTDSSNSDEERP